MMIKSLVFVFPLILGFTMGQTSSPKTIPTSAPTSRGSTTTAAPSQCPSQQSGPTNGFNTQSLSGTYILAAMLYDSNFTSPAPPPPLSLVNDTSYFNMCNLTESLTLQNNVVNISYNQSSIANITLTSDGKGTGMADFGSNITAPVTWLIAADGWMAMAYCFTYNFWWQQSAFDVIVLLGPPTVTPANVNAKIAQIQATGIVLDAVENFCGGSDPPRSVPVNMTSAAEWYRKN